MLVSGDSCLIITPKNKKILIDTGEDLNILIPYLLDRKIKYIDYLIISHFDTDHCGDVINLLDKIKIKQIIISKQFIISEEYINIKDKALSKKVKVIEAKRGDKLFLDKYLHLDIIYPEEKLYFEDLNNNSLVLKLNYFNFSMLFTGDIGIEAEHQIINTNARELRSNILKVAHHGTRTSTSEAFAGAVLPQIAIIGVRRK